MRLSELACAPLPLDLALRSDGLPDQPVLLVDLDAPASAVEVELAERRLGATPQIVIGVADRAVRDLAFARRTDLCLARHASGPMTVAVDDPAAAANDLVAAVAQRPVAALTLAWVLRASAGLRVADALAVESSAYSMLLAGAEFASWLRGRGEPRAPDGRHRVAVSRHGNTLSVRLDRPARRNAVDAAMRDAIVEALRVAEAEPELTVEITGSGSSFSSGGDLDEFGSARDVATAHVVRVGASAGTVLARIADRVTARLHGVCMGAGVEIPAFAGRVVAAPGTELALPEFRMGLIPGAGGTVSIPRRIGRWRTLWLGLTASRLPIETALQWGLVDAVVDGLD